LVQIRDSLAVTYQRQLDEIAGALVQMFAERDQSAVPTLPEAPGLFTYPGAPAMPLSTVGLAGLISINPSADPAQGGDPERLRDGGINGAAYIYNPTGASGYSQRLQDLIGRFDAQRAFDPAAGVASSTSLPQFASSSAGWLEGARKSADEAMSYQSAVLERASAVLTKETGVSLDEQMMLLLDLERSYQASAKLITTIDNMLGTLMAATR
jgi:flagellar hook-associated protein 1 FlgK